MIGLKNRGVSLDLKIKLALFISETFVFFKALSSEQGVGREPVEQWVENVESGIESSVPFPAIVLKVCKLLRAGLDADPEANLFVLKSLRIEELTTQNQIEDPELTALLITPEPDGPRTLH